MADPHGAPNWGPEEIDRYCSELQREYERLRPLLPDIPAGDLMLILSGLLRPFGTGKSFFLRRLENGSYVI